MNQRRVLTGITPSGTPHLGNYVGAIRPAIQASRDANVEGFFFLSDYHALIKCQAPERVHQSTLEIAATWLALGLDTSKVHFYRQSDIPEIPELTWILGCVAAKGLLNRAHAYKAAADANRERSEDEDAGISMGLFSYPVLMAADILIFGAGEVPVGRDQVQHIEMARDMAQRLNHLYGSGNEPLLVIPQAVVDDNVATLPGLDGRKMSKSYNNTIPLWLSSKQLKKAIGSIVTNSLEPGQPKDPDSAHLFQIYGAFASDLQRREFAEELRGGLGWGAAKAKVYEHIDAELSPARARYDELMANPQQVEDALIAGAERVRPIGQERVSRVRHAVGLRPLSAPAQQAKSGKRKQKGPRFVSYSDGGKFNFKFSDSDGTLLAAGPGFDSPALAGAGIKQFRELGTVTDRWREDDGTWHLYADSEAPIAASASDMAVERIIDALQRV